MSCRTETPGACRRAFGAGAWSPRRAERRVPSARRGGFTLIELLVVIAIIATLAGIVAPEILRHTSDAKAQAAASQVEMLSLALDTYRLDNGSYPSTEQGLSALRVMPTIGGAPQNWRGPYLRRTVPSDPWGRPYSYASPGRYNRGGFDLFSLGRDGRSGGEHEDADITSWGGAVAP